MINHIVSRVLSAGVLVIITACFTHILDVHRSQMGQSAYLANESARYDRYLAHPHSIIINLLANMILIGVVLAAYELVAFVVLKIMVRINTDSSIR